MTQRDRPCASPPDEPRSVDNLVQAGPGTERKARHRLSLARLLAVAGAVRMPQGLCLTGRVSPGRRLGEQDVRGYAGDGGHDAEKDEGGEEAEAERGHGAYAGGSGSGGGC
jgi:hypothetical protein